MTRFYYSERVGYNLDPKGVYLFWMRLYTGRIVLCRIKRSDCYPVVVEAQDVYRLPEAMAFGAVKMPSWASQ
jgi:hypothetical protein